MQLQPDSFNRFLAGIGQDVSWKAATACPCTNPSSGSPDPVCPQCGGQGFVWGAGVAAIIGITAQNVSKQMRDFGQYEQGDVVATIGSDSPVYDIGHMDRVVLLNVTERFSRTRTHGQDDLVFDLAVVSISRVYWLTNNKTTIVEGGIPTWNPTTKALTWTSGEPPAGTLYSITGVQNVEYFAYDNLPANRNEHEGAALPRKLQLRRFDLFGRR